MSLVLPSVAEGTSPPALASATDDVTTDALREEHREGTVHAIARYDPDADAPVGASQEIGVRVDKIRGQCGSIRRSARLVAESHGLCLSGAGRVNEISRSRGSAERTRAQSGAVSSGTALQGTSEMDDQTNGGAGSPEPPREPAHADLIAGEFVTETLLDYDGGRQVTVYVPPKSGRGSPVRRRRSVDFPVGWVPRSGRCTVHDDRRCTRVDRREAAAARVFPGLRR